ncbi:MAG: hypothetical protein IM595_01665, partial [Phenylobacterium sp.]|nr:hypothetical protein [Phenylobacterium sp.]
MHTPPVLEPRQIELGDRCVEVLAPVGWTDAQTEAWREVLGGTADISGAITALAAEIAQAAQGRNRLGGKVADLGLSDRLSTLMLNAAAAIGVAPGPAPALVD